MRSVLPCSYQPRHAAPREALSLETRSVLAVGLAAAVLPLSAAPVLADEAPATSTAGTGTSSSTASPAASPSEQPSQQQAAPSPSPSTGSTQASGTTEASPAATASSSPSPYSVGAGASPSASPSPSAASSAPARTAERRASTSLSFSAPASARSASVPVGIRLLSDGKAVRNGYVRIEKATPGGWAFAGRLLTGSDGAGRGILRVAGSTKLRAAYTGSEVRTPAVSPARTVRSTDAGGAVLQEAAKHVGKPYRYGAVGPNAFDCSGFTRYVFGTLGKSLPHNSRAQESMATPVSKSEARPGDLVFIQDVAGHVGIYAGDGRMYDAPRSGKTVSLRKIWTTNYTLGRV